MILSRSFPASSSSLFNTIQHNSTENSIYPSITALQNINCISIANIKYKRKQCQVVIILIEKISSNNKSIHTFSPSISIPGGASSPGGPTSPGGPSSPTPSPSGFNSDVPTTTSFRSCRKLSRVRISFG